ncbi:glycosyltransferase family 39 protein [Sphingomonas sp.]|uniref:glycosyltransferase family 39 protein n=1 Tax=Sphingomonas sp. TaxID=28214 RepID=UPI003CC62C98
MLGWFALALLLAALALLHPIDHDESQYVAAAVLAAHGLLPYRDFAYLQTPLQPFLLAPVTWTAGRFAWPVLRIVNSLFGAVAIRCVFGAAREIAGRRTALAAAALFGCTDILLFAAGTARNDALPAACLAGALWLAIRAERARGSRWQAVATGLLLAAAAAAKLSYALPAMVYGMWALWQHRRHRPLFVMLGAAPVGLFVACMWRLSPQAFGFDVFTFPVAGPADFYADRPWKLSRAAKLADTVKFLALGPALVALLMVVRRRMPALLVLLTVAGLIAAMLPTPVWRQYLLPMLPPLFVLLSHRWGRTPPGAAVRALMGMFAVAGLAPTAVALASGQPSVFAAMREMAAVRAAMDRAGAAGPVATLSPQFLAATGRLPDPRFATGPFYFRSRSLQPPGGELVQHVISARALPCVPLPRMVLVGGEGVWTSGDPRLDALLALAATQRGYRGVPVGRWTLYVR